MASRKGFSEAYRPQQAKSIQLGLPWTSGGQASIVQSVDLSLPIRGIKIVLKGRLTTAVAPFTSVAPEGLLNLLSNITIQGTNARQGGNVTLWNIDGATAWVLSHLFAYRGAGHFTLSTGGAAETIAAIPSTPFPAGYFATANATYDFKIVWILPFHPFESNAYGKMPLSVPGFLVRNEEWKDSLQILLT